MKETEAEMRQRLAGLSEHIRQLRKELRDAEKKHESLSSRLYESENETAERGFAEWCGFTVKEWRKLSDHERSDGCARYWAAERAAARVRGPGRARVRHKSRAEKLQRMTVANGCTEHEARMAAEKLRIMGWGDK